MCQMNKKKESSYTLTVGESKNAKSPSTFASVFAFGVLSGKQREQTRSRAEDKQPSELFASESSHSTPTRSQLPCFVMHSSSGAKNKKRYEWLVPGFPLQKHLTVTLSKWSLSGVVRGLLEFFFPFFFCEHIVSVAIHSSF